MKILLTFVVVGTTATIVMEILMASASISGSKDTKEILLLSSPERAIEDDRAIITEHRGKRAIFATILAIAKFALPYIKLAAGIATKMNSESQSSAILGAIEEANRKLDEINSKLNRLSSQMQEIRQHLRVAKLATVFGRDVQRLNFFTSNTRLNQLPQINLDAWADAVLSLGDDGIDQVLFNIHDMITGGSIFNHKSIINVFVDGIPTNDEGFWRKVDGLANALTEMETAGYTAWLIALGVKRRSSEITRVVNLATERLTQQDRVFGPLNFQSLRVWPADRYGLVRVRNSGCPVGSWATARRYHDTEDSKSENSWSNPLHMDGSWGRNNMAWKFCMKTSSTGGPAWPNGKYCVFAKYGCPRWMVKGMLYWDDEDKNNENSVTGSLPDGQYDRNTRIDFCCKTSGSTASEIKLPIQKPFFLFPLQGQGCQKVYKMTAREEYFHWDCEDSRNENSRRMPHPKEGDGGRNMRVYMCYYERTKKF